jgi:hypothetical protein
MFEQARQLLLQRAEHRMEVVSILSICFNNTIAVTCHPEYVVGQWIHCISEITLFNLLALAQKLRICRCMSL